MSGQPGVEEGFRFLASRSRTHPALQQQHSQDGAPSFNEARGSVPSPGSAADQRPTRASIEGFGNFQKQSLTAPGGAINTLALHTGAQATQEAPIVGWGPKALCLRAWRKVSEVVAMGGGDSCQGATRVLLHDSS